MNIIIWDFGNCSSSTSLQVCVTLPSCLEKCAQNVSYLSNTPYIDVCVTIDVDAEYVREMIYMLVDDLYLRRDKQSIIEQRIEDLETRVTEQSLNYQVQLLGLAGLVGVWSYVAKILCYGIRSVV